MENGANVCMFGRDHGKLTAAKNVRHSGMVKTIKHDFLTEPEMLESKVREALVFFQGELDGLIICHGMIQSGTIRETNLKEWDKIMAVNVRGVFHLSSLCVNFLKERKGCITVLSGAAGE